jgi:hypothetical protein
MEKRLKISRNKPNATGANDGKKDKYKRRSPNGLSGNEAGLTGQGNSLEKLEALAESKSRIRAARFRESVEVDLSVDYIPGEVSGEARADFEKSPGARGEDGNDSYAETANSISELSRRRSPEAPPPFAKEKVMARVRDGSIVYFVPPSDQQLSLIHEKDG